MASASPIPIDTDQLRCEVSSLYSKVAANPNGNFHFHRGPAYAEEFLGYDGARLATISSESTAAFAGVGNPFRMGPISAGERVVDIGCGAGMDLLAAGQMVGPEGAAIGVDMTDAMIERATASAHAMGLSHVEVRKGDCTSLPVGDSSVDVVISNGVLNLVPEKPEAFAEVFRILRPGGRFQLADIVVDTELSEGIRRNIDLWTA